MGADHKILVVDDEPGVRSALSGILEDEGYHVEGVDSGERAVGVAASGAFDAILLDVWLPGIDGLETLKRLRAEAAPSSEPAVVMISGHGTIETAVRATKLGAFDFVEKPLSLERTLLVLRNALRQRQLERRNRSLVRQLSRDTEVLGQSEASERVRRAVEAAAAVDAAVLVVGERGTGRESMIRHLYAAGTRSDRAFVEVRCAALDEASVQGVVLSAGDERDRARLARGGLLFLADVDALSADAQSRLAARVASSEFTELDIRLLSTATAADERIRPELMERLAEVRIDVPPLRERAEDIPFLVERFVADLATEYGVEPPSLTPGAIEALRGRSWPGNVRELRNVVESAVVTWPGRALGAGDVRVSRVPADRRDAFDPEADHGALSDALASFERYYCRRALSRTGGDLSRAAESLGISVAKLRRRLD